MIKNNLSLLLFLGIGTLVLITRRIYLARKFQKQMNPYRDKLEALAEIMPGIPCKLLGFMGTEPGLAGHWSEHKFTLRYCGGDLRSLPICVELKLYIRPSIKFSIYSNYKCPGMVLFLKKIYTDDVDLDKYDFYSNKPDEAKKYLISHRVILKQLNDCGWEMPVFNRRSISIHSDFNSSYDVESIKAALQNMKALTT